MHSVITEDDTGHIRDTKETNKRREKTILCKQGHTIEKQVKRLHILSFSRILYKILLSNSRG